MVVQRSSVCGPTSLTGSRVLMIALLYRTLIKLLKSLKGQRPQGSMGPARQNLPRRYFSQDAKLYRPAEFRSCFLPRAIKYLSYRTGRYTSEPRRLYSITRRCRESTRNRATGRSKCEVWVHLHQSRVIVLEDWCGYLCVSHAFPTTRTIRRHSMTFKNSFSNRFISTREIPPTRA